MTKSFLGLSLLTLTLLFCNTATAQIYPLGQQDPVASGFTTSGSARNQSGWQFKVNSHGVTVQKMGSNYPTGATTTKIVTLFDSTTEMKIAQVTCGPGAGWQFTNLATPVKLIKGREYVIAGFTLDGFYNMVNPPTSWMPTGDIEHVRNRHAYLNGSYNQNTIPNRTLTAFRGVVDFGYTKTLSIITPEVLTASEQTSYTSNIQAAMGTPTYTWTSVSGTLPQGLSLNQVGQEFQLSGTPDAGTAGTYNFDVQVMDSSGATDTRTMLLYVSAYQDTMSYPAELKDPVDYGFTYLSQYPGLYPPATSGWRFRANSAGINVLRLGTNYPPELTTSQTVTLFDYNTREILVQVTCPPGAGWQYTDLATPLELTNGREYLISAHSVNGFYQSFNMAASWLPNGDIEYLVGQYEDTTDPNHLPTFAVSTVHYGVVDFGYTKRLAIDTTAELPAGSELATYSTNIQADFGSTSYTWTDNATLPSGLSFSQVGNDYQLSGTPSAGSGGTYIFDVTVTDAASATYTKTMSLYIQPQAVSAPFSDDFSTDKGWQYGVHGWLYGADWDRGSAVAYTETAPDRWEPADDNTSTTDNYIAGHNIGADYGRELNGFVWLTSPVVDCSAIPSSSKVALRFYRYLGCSLGDEAIIELSVDGGQSWSTIWTTYDPNNTMSNTIDSAWTQFGYELPDAAGKSTVQVRFGIGNTGSIVNTGWCIDDVEILEPGPQLEVREGAVAGTIITDDEAVGGLRDFGQVATSTQVPLSIYIFNNGFSTIDFTGFSTTSKSGPNAGDFTLQLANFNLSLPPNTGTSFDVIFYSTTTGIRTCTIEIPHDVQGSGSGTTPFEINLRADAVASVPVIEVALASNAVNIPHQDPATMTNTRDFGSVNGGNSSAPIDIVITNAGTAPLDVIVDMGSVDWFHFTINGIPTNPTPSAITQTIPPQTNWSFSIAFEPNGSFPGQKDAYVRITHNDQAHPSYSSGYYEVPVKGFCVTSAPLIGVSDGGLINHNDTAAGNRDFGDIVRNTTSAPLTITISNSGGSAMNVGVPALGGTGVSEYSLDLTNFGTPAAAVSLAANNSITFDIIFAPTSVGQKDATVSFTHNDTSVTSPFIINITGTGVIAAPVIEVSDGSTLLANPDTLDFGQQDVTAGPTAAVVITVENTGTAPLTLGVPTFNPVTSNFVLNTTGFPTSLAIGASATFSIEFDPAQEGSLTTIIEFTHNDGTTGTPYILNLTGVGIAPVVEVREGSTTGVVVNSGDVAILGGGRDLGSIDVSAGATGPITISLKNTGSLNLDIYTIALAGTNVADFILNAPGVIGTLTTGADTSFTITFDPTLGGIKNAQVVFTHNDPTNPSPFIIRIIGTAVDPNGVQIATTSLPAGNSDVAYMPTALTAIQGTAPYVWSVYSGNLPAGLTLSSEGLITGTPNSLVTNTYEFTVRVTDTTGATHEKQLPIIVVGSVIVPVGSPGASGCVATGGALALPLLLSLLLLAAHRRKRREEV